MKDTDILPAPELDLRPPVENKWQREHRAFLKLYWFSLKWKFATFELASKGDIFLKPQVIVQVLGPVATVASSLLAIPGGGKVGTGRFKRWHRSMAAS